MPPEPLNLVISYSPEDAKYYTAIYKQLKLLENQGFVKLWSKGEITLGSNMEAEMVKAIQSAQVLLLLISIDYLLSDEYLFISGNLNRLPRERIVPVLTGNCDWKAVPELAKLTILPADNIPVSDKTDNQLYNEVIEELKKLFQKISGLIPAPDKPFASIPPPPTGHDTDNPKLLQLKYTCNRTVQKGEFLKATLLNRNQKIHYYYIRGLVKQSTEGLSRRFYHREIPGNPIFGNKNISPNFVYISLVPDADLEVFKLNFLSDLYDQLKCTDQEIFFNGNILHLLNALCVRTYDVVCVGAKLKSEHWNTSVPLFLEWLVTDFCNCNQPDMPVFFFFLMIDYASEVHRQSIENELKTLKEKFLQKNITAQLLSPLDKVPRVDIEIWLESTLRQSDVANRLHLLHQYFGAQDEFDMSEVEQKLEEIIRQHNSEI
ncbi:TIR domain-containing protein [Sphingobacteriales bacterium UPWRP_1]|nr:hypothetical protein B6N25_07385 [Sphingobacteriales bacterium TSM_CSS]PSJ78715.1 TIR domain-containing protein [Sphingobacteriales bacterium UPWRP_1]